MPPIEPETARRATEAIPSIPRDAHSLVFREPCVTDAMEYWLVTTGSIPA